MKKRQLANIFSATIEIEQKCQKLASENSLLNVQIHMLQESLSRVVARYPELNALKLENAQLRALKARKCIELLATTPIRKFSY